PHPARTGVLQTLSGRGQAAYYDAQKVAKSTTRDHGSTSSYGPHWAPAGLSTRQAEATAVGGSWTAGPHTGSGFGGGWTTQVPSACRSTRQPSSSRWGWARHSCRRTSLLV